MSTWNGVRSLEIVVTAGSINRVFSCSILLSTVSMSNNANLNKKRQRANQVYTLPLICCETLNPVSLYLSFSEWYQNVDHSAHLLLLSGLSKKLIVNETRYNSSEDRANPPDIMMGKLPRCNSRAKDTGGIHRTTADRTSNHRSKEDYQPHGNSCKSSRCPPVHQSPVNSENQKEGNDKFHQNSASNGNTG